MRRLVSVLSAAVLVACSKKEAAPAADTTPAPPPAPPALTQADINGKWHAKVMTEASDSVILEYDLVADSTGFTMTFPGRKKTEHATVVLSGDSAITDAGPYESALRKGVMVTTHGVFRMQAGEMVGMTVATYSKGPDSVRTLRSRATRVP